MATSCDSCGKRENEVKSASGIEPLGKRITLHITDVSDLNRDILKVRKQHSSTFTTKDFKKVSFFRRG